MNPLAVDIAATRCARPPELLQAALDMVAEAVFLICPVSRRVMDANHAAYTTLGYSRAELLDTRVEDIVPTAKGGALAELIERALAGESAGESIRCAHRHRDGSEVPVQVSLRRVKTEVETCLIMVTRTVGSVGAARESAAVEARDGLTGLPCRMVIERRIEREARRAADSKSPFAVFFLDIDHFKRVNDTRGHVAGNRVLQAVARRLHSCLRPTDMASRFGGDEFVAIVTGIGTEADAIQVARRIRRALRRAIDAGGREVTVSASIGVVVGPNGFTDARGLIDAADQAMYRAKARGRRGYFALYKSNEAGVLSVNDDPDVTRLAIAPAGHTCAPRLPR